ncbi:MAG: putative outer rane efflux protein of [Proteobacteria bacterium]|nr:putative outer rane efflux protein of [Pseudomonadota bacterium]
MGLTHKTLLYLSVTMGSLLTIADASCELITYPVSFVNEDKSSASSAISGPKKERSNNTPIVYVKAVEEISLPKKQAPVVSTATTKKSVIISKEKYSLRSAIWMVVSWHPGIKRAKAETERLKSIVDEVRSSYYPNVEMGLNSGIEKDSYTDDNNRTNQLNVSIEQMIYDFGSTGDRVELSELNVISANYEVEKEVNDILYQTISAYLQIVRYHQLIAAAKDRIDGFTKIRDITKKRVALGASAESDYSQASLRVAESLSNYNDYISQYKKWSATLDYLLNKEISSKIIMEFPAEVEELYNNLLRDNPTNTESPAVRIARAKIDISKKQIDVQRNGHYPKITLTPYYEHDLTAKSTGNSVAKNRNRYGAFINVKVPLYQGGAVSSKVQQAQEALNTAQFNLDTEQNNAKQKIMEFFSQMINTKISLENKLEREQSAIRTRNLYMSQYLELGTRSFSDLTSAESEIHQTKADIINSNYAVSNLALESLYYAGKLMNLLENKG